MNILSWIASGVSVVVFLGAAVVYLKGSADKGAREAYRQTAEALLLRVTVLEAEVARLKVVEAENVILRGAVNSREDIAEVREHLDNHHDAMIGELGKIHTDLAAILGELRRR